MLRDIKDIIEIVKDILSSEKDGNIYDKDVAKALNITCSNMATAKKRGKIPFEKLCDFASRNGLDLNYILTHDTKRINYVG